MKILYIHGYNGSPQGHSYSLLKKHLPEGAEIFGMDYFQDDCAVALEQIRRTIEEKGIDVVVGSSLGGFLTILTAGIERYIINPCYLPSVELPKLGPKDGLPAPTPEMIATYAAFEPMLDKLDDADKKRIHVLIGDKDELLGERYYDMIAGNLGVKPSIVFSEHHLSESAAVTVCSLIESGERMTSDAHKYATANEYLVNRSEKCGCFSCGRVFGPDKIEVWANDSNGRTAVCPYCNVDAVLSDNNPYGMDKDFLDRMHERWF